MWILLFVVNPGHAKVDKFLKKQKIRKIAITSYKLNIFQFFKNVNLRIDIYLQNDTKGSIIFGPKNYLDFIENCLFFTKNAEKSKIQKFMETEKKFFWKKVVLRSSYISEENQNPKNERNRRWSRAAWSLFIKIRS